MAPELPNPDARQDDGEEPSEEEVIREAREFIDKILERERIVIRPRKSVHPIVAEIRKNLVVITVVATAFGAVGVLVAKNKEQRVPRGLRSAQPAPVPAEAPPDPAVLKASLPRLTPADVERACATLEARPEVRGIATGFRHIQERTAEKVLIITHAAQITPENNGLPVTLICSHDKVLEPHVPFPTPDAPVQDLTSYFKKLLGATIIKNLGPFSRVECDIGGTFGASQNQPAIVFEDVVGDLMFPTHVVQSSKRTDGLVDKIIVKDAKTGRILQFKEHGSFDFNPSRQGDQTGFKDCIDKAIEGLQNSKPVIPLELGDNEWRPFRPRGKTPNGVKK